MKNILLLLIILTTASCYQKEAPTSSTDNTNNPVKKASINKGKKGNTVMCTADVKECPDGSFVGRDSKNNCKFRSCPN